VEIEVSAFGNFSTDTVSTDCKHKRDVDRQSRTGLIYSSYYLGTYWQMDAAFIVKQLEQ